MNVKQQRLESLLLEVLSEAFSSLGDGELNTLTITAVKCSRGKQSAEVYIEGSDVDAQDRARLVQKLNKAQNILKEYILSSTQWFRAPKLLFKFDDSLHNANSLDEIFKKLAQNSYVK